MEVPAWLPSAAAERAQHPAIEAAGETLTYATLLARADAAARRLARHDAGPGERVAIVLEPGAAFAETLHACLRLGAVAVPVDHRLPDAERSVQTAGAAVVVDEPLGGREGRRVKLRDTHDLDAIAMVVHTSGSSGAPKPVELTYGNWLWNALGSGLALRVGPAERWLCTLPLNHVGGLSILVRSAISATTAVIHPRFDAEAAGHAITHDAITMVSVVATTLARLLDAGLDRPPALRCALVGGGPVPEALLARAEAAGIPLAQTYGLTEACSVVTVSAIGDPRTAGRPIAPTRVDLAEDGEILVSGTTVSPGALGVDGRLRTGDLGALDEQGRLTVTGRKSDTIVSGGENVAPAEVEAVLEAHPAVAEAAVHGRPDPDWGEAVVATVVLREGMRVGPEDLRAHCAGRLAGFKVPKAIVLSGALPRTESGKLRRGLFS